MSFISQPTVCEINQSVENFDSKDKNSCAGNMGNRAEDTGALLKDGENVSETLVLGNSGNTESRMGLSIIHILNPETDSLKSEDCDNTSDLIESYKAVIRQQAIELQIEREKNRNTVICRTPNDLDHVTGLETSDTNADTVVDLKLQLDNLNSTIEGIVCRNTMSAKKITKLEMENYTSERTLNETIENINYELNVLKCELHTTQSEIECSREIEKKKSAEDKYLMEKNESLTQDLNNLQKSLEDLKRNYMWSTEEANGVTKDKINGLEHDLNRSSSVKNNLLQREQGNVAITDIGVIVKSLERLKRQNTVLDIRIQNSIGPSIRTVDETESRSTNIVPEQCDRSALDESFVVTKTLCESALETYGSLSTDDCFMPKRTKDERIEELQRRLDGLEKVYTEKERWYQKTIAKLETKVRKDKEFRVKMYEVNIKEKENKIVDLMEDFRVLVRTKNEEHEYVRGGCKEVIKELKDEKTLLELEEANARERMRQLNEKYNDECKKLAELSSRVDEPKKQPVVKGKPPVIAARKIANVKPQVTVAKLMGTSKAVLPPLTSFITKQKVPAKAPTKVPVKAPVKASAKVSVKDPVKAPVKAPSKTSVNAVVKVPVPKAAVVRPWRNPNATKVPEPVIRKTKTPTVKVASVNSNGSAARLAWNEKDSKYNAVEARNRAQRERDQKIEELRERYKQQKAAGIPIGGLPAFYVPPENRWKI